MDIWSLLPSAIILLISCFFACAAFALRDFSKHRLEEFLTRKNKLHRLKYIQEHQTDLQITCAVIRTAANLALVLFIVRIFRSDYINWIIITQAFIISLVLVSIFSVIIPQTWAKYSGETFLAYTVPVLKIAKMLFLPIIILMKWTDIFIKRLSGIDESKEDEESVQQELLEAVQEGEEEGIVDAQERKMIESVIEMRSITVGQIMTPRTEIDAIDANLSLDEIKKLATEHGHSRIPVYEENLDNIIGMLYVKDLLPYVGEKIEQFDVRSIMRQCYFVPETKKLRDLFHEFRARKIHVAIVLDEYGGTLGLVTFEDLIEQIVGQITDEYEQPEEPLIKQIDSQTLEIDARMRIDELNDEYKLELPESEDFETIAGFLFSSLGRIPKAGETFQYKNLLFTILEAEERKINRVRLEILPENIPTANTATGQADS